jgi:hypothetical protein
MKSKLASTFAGIALLATAAHAASTAYNFGSLGAAADGVNADAVTLNVPGALAVPGDLAIGYSGGSRTVVPYNSSLNPASAAPFTIEFWANPSGSDGDDVALGNRTSASPRGGWAFFQRAGAVGWNLRMYNGSGTATGVDITGGTSTIGAWSHVVGVWDGTNATLFVNGVDTSATGTNGAGYRPNDPGITLSIGSHDLASGSSPYEGLVDETAFYGSALTPAQIAAHYSAASNTTPDFYQSLVLTDGALLYINNVPEPTSLSLLALSLVGLIRRKRS